MSGVCDGLHAVLKHEEILNSESIILLKRQKKREKRTEEWGELVALVLGCGSISSKGNVGIDLQPTIIYKYNICPIIIFLSSSILIVSRPSNLQPLFLKNGCLAESEMLMTLFDDLLKSRDVITATEFVTKRKFVLF